MTIYANLQRWLPEIELRRTPEPEAAFFYYEESNRGRDKLIDCRNDRSLTNHLNNIHPLFGTENDLLEDIVGNRDYPAIRNPQSCQASSAVWCKYMLRRSERIERGERDLPIINVHNDENCKRQIAQLTNTVFNEDRNAFGGMNLQIKKVMEKLIKNAGLEPLAITPTSPNILFFYIFRAVGKPVMIWMKSHMIAIYMKDQNEFYIFDNTIGCLRFDTREAVKAWLLWACKRNGETVKKNWVYHFHPRWLAVKCSLPQA